MAFTTTEIEVKARALGKAAARGDPSSTVLSLIDELRRGVSATADMLRTTKVGMSVGRLRQHKDPIVARQATELVNKWRNDIAKRPNGSGSSTPKKAEGGVNVDKWRSSVALEKRNTKTDGVNTSGTTESETRNSCIKLMYDGLVFMAEEVPNDILRIAVAVEQAAYEAFQPETSLKYKEKLRSLYQNLKNKSNGDLRQRVRSGSIPPAKFVRMTHDELKSAERRAEDAKLMKENMDKAMVAQEEKSISTQLQCGKCGQRKVSYTQAQTRSADEPMTTFCECLNCGNRWKFS